MKARKILFVNLSSTQFGGGEVYLLNLLRHFRERAEVAVACARENGLMLERVRALGVRHREFPLGYRHLPGVVRSLAEWQAEEGFDLVHANGRRSQLSAALLAGRTGVPVVGADLVATLTWSGRPAEVAQNLVAALVNRLVAVPRMKRIVVLCEHMRQESLRWLRIPPERLVTVYNAVDPDHFAPQPPGAELKRSLGFPAESPVIGCSARLVPHKGQGLLVEAVARLRRSDLRVLLIGDGPDEEDLRRRIAALGLEPQFHLMDFPLDLRPYLALVDVLVLPSSSEGLPTALLQGMAMERPVVGTDVQGIPEVIRDGVNGRLFPLGDADALADRLRELLDSPDRRAEMGREGRRRVLEDFSLSRMLERLEAVYDQALA